MVKIRLKRIGKKHEAIYRIVATDSRNPRDGKFIEEIGFYNPHSKELKFDLELKNKWVKNGAQYSSTVKNLFKNFDSNNGSSIIKSDKNLKKSKK